MLIWEELLYFLLSIRQLKLADNLPKLQDTLFGWIFDERTVRSTDSRHKNIQKHVTYGVTKKKRVSQWPDPTILAIWGKSIKPPPGAKAGGCRRLFAAKFPQARVRIHRRHWEDISIDLDWYCRSKVSTNDTEKQPSRRGQVFPIVHTYIWINFFTIPRNKMQAEIGRMPHRRNALGRASIDPG